MATIITEAQTKWKDCYQTSETVKLTLRTNGEEKTQVITPFGEVVRAGFEAPTAAPTAVVSVGGTLEQDRWYSYVYVYASSNYPYVQNAVTTADGELWPRSNPSSAISKVTTAANKTITVTVTKTTRSDIDKILVYRTEPFTTQDLADEAAAAGQMFYIATVANNSIAGTTTVIDNGITSTGEVLEADNYLAETTWFNVFDGRYWWCAGNPVFEAPVTLDGTNVVVQSGDFPWFDGRDGQVASFIGINAGGFDGRGSFYFKWLDGTHGKLYTDPDLTVAATFPYTGTSTIKITGRTSVLYRSKPFNPFSWGLTQNLVNDDGSETNIPQSFALELGGGAVTAMAVVQSGKKLKIDFENPQKTITLDLEFAESEQFGTSEKVIDNTGSVTCHHAQFYGYLGEIPMLMGIDTYNGNILACDGDQVLQISESLGGFVASLLRDDNAHRDFHGAYDPETEMNCWWVRFYDTDCRDNVLIWMHAPTKEWGWMPDFNVSCSSTLLDADNNERFLIGGTDQGHIGRLFNTEFYDNWMNGIGWRNSVQPVGYGFNANLRYTITLNSNDSHFKQTISSYDDAGTINFSSTPQCAAGDSIHINGNVSFDTTVTAISGNAVTVYPWTSQGGVFTISMMVDGTRANGIWGMILQADGLNWWLCNFTSVSSGISSYVFEVTEYIERGSDTIQTNEGTDPTDAPWYNISTPPLLFFGNIPCQHRSYYDVNRPTMDKRPLEMWLTAENVGIPGSTYKTFAARHYSEYQDDADPSDTFIPKRIKQAPNSLTEDSNVWLSKTGVPTKERKQFGMEISEVSNQEFRLFNYVLKLKPDRP